MGVLVSARCCLRTDIRFTGTAMRISMAGAVAFGMTIAIFGGCSEAKPAEARQTSHGSTYVTLYDDDTLAYWAKRYEPAIRDNFSRLIVDSLSPSQRIKVRGLTVQFPLRGDNDPLNYYSEAPPPTITLSAMSVKFLDDIATASAWLDANGYSTETVEYYAEVLKYRGPQQFASGRYPSPLKALGVPPNAVRDSDVNHVALNILNSAVLFALAHEVGHLVNGHQPVEDIQQRQRQEMEADRFAISAFRRIGLTPAGIVTFFLFTSHFLPHRGDFESDSAWAVYAATRDAHPLSSRRLTALATMLQSSPEDFARSDGNRTGAVQRVRFVAKQIAGIATLVDDPLMHRHGRLVGEEIPLSELAPRRKGDTWVPARFRTRR